MHFAFRRNCNEPRQRAARTRKCWLIMQRGYRGIARLRLLNATSVRGWIEFGWLRLPCAIGRGGLRCRKREGDGATPQGRLALRDVQYRPDRVSRPRSPIRTQALRPDAGWCDAPADRNYNRPVKRPYAASSEALWRDDALYDCVLVLDHNIVPRMRGMGSAIFLHVARPDLGPTEGCIALAHNDLMRLLHGPVPLRAIDTPILLANRANRVQRTRRGLR
jgi:L,D-peptidoglycan transpeptidase YkuD (ErfK/YbiS/YcfS/YnhG family)